MEIKITTQHILNVLNVLSWIIFIGVCFEAGGFLSSMLYALFFNPIGAHNFWQGADLSQLYAFDKGQFAVISGLMVVVSVLRSLLFYLIIKLLHDKKLDMSQPFSGDVKQFISLFSYIALGIGIFSAMGVNYRNWFVQQGIAMPDSEQLRIGGADVWLFMAVILFVIAQIFKRGIEIQSENDLTV